MIDVFISYASENREHARQLANTLESCGWSVWWDRNIVAGQAYDEAIEQALGSTHSVVVLWSKDSISSEWVKNEATFAAERGVLVPAFIERVPLPLEFRRKQTVDLTDWNGDPTHAGFQALHEGISAKAMTAGRPSPQLPATRSRPRFGWNRRGVWIAVAILLGALGVGVQRGWLRPASPPAAHPLGVSPPTPENGDGRPATPSLPAHDAAKPAGLADAAAGTYHGDVVSDSKGSSQSDVTVTIARVNQRRVRISSDYARLGTVEVDLTRTGQTIMNANGDSTVLLDLGKTPPRLDYNPGGVAYAGQRQ